MMRKQFAGAICAVLALSLSGCGGGTSSNSNSGGGGNNNPPPVNGAVATVDFGNVHQTIRGFGAAEAWFGVMSNPAINALYGTSTGQIGLSIMRVRIDPSSTTAGSQWDAELTNAANAVTAGSNVSIIATPWTPPPAWKVNIPDTSNPVAEGSLDPANYANYANYLESYVTYAASKGVTLYGISMQNEPDANVTYESCVWTPTQMDTWVAQNSGVLTTKLIMPESESFTQSYSSMSLSDSNAVGNIGIIAGHLYGTNPVAYTAAATAGKELWMTEHYFSGTDINSALLTAQEIHNSMTVGNYNAYVWWWMQDWPSQNSFIGLIDANNNVKPAGAAMAQFARFVRPGYVRTDVTSSTPNVFVSAYKGNGHFVIVATNMGASDVSQPFTIQNQSITSMVPYQTTGSAMLAPQTSVNVSGSQFTYTLPAKSITTFVQ